MNSFKNKDILIYQSENVHVELIDNRIEGELNKVNWNELHHIAFALVNIITNVKAKAEAVSFFSFKGNDGVRSGIRITVLLESEIIDIEPLVNSFLLEITKNDNSTAELFNQNSTPFYEIVKKEAQSFLAQHSNKTIKQDLEVQTGELFLKLSGKFGQFTNNEEAEEEPAETQRAVVDGLVNHNRTVNLKLGNQKIILAYFNQTDYLQLYLLMGTKEPHKFITQRKNDVKGKKDLYLIAIEKESEKFLNLIS